MMHALNELCIAAKKVTQSTTRSLIHFLNYCASNPDAKTIYRKIDMLLTVDSDAAYPIVSKSRSREDRYFYLGNKDGKLFNGPIFILAQVIKSVMASESEAERGGLYMNAQESVPIRNTLVELGHIQPPYVTPVRTDKITTDGIMNRTVKPKKPKSMYMRFWWLVDILQQNQFIIFWAPGNVNLVDYLSKKYPASHFIKVRPIYLYIHKKIPSLIQGCYKILAPEIMTKHQTYVRCTDVGTSIFQMVREYSYKN